MSDVPATAIEIPEYRTKAWWPIKGSPWPERDPELIRLWLAGPSAREIAREMFGTPKAVNKVVGRARRLGLPGRPSPIRGPHAHSGPRTGKHELEHAMKVTMPETRTVAGGHTVPLEHYEARRATVRGPTLDATPRVYVPPRTTLSSGQGCQWIIGNPAGVRTIFCNAPRQGWPTYCPEHHEVCYPAMVRLG